MVNPAGPLAAIDCQPRQAWKGAAVTVDSGAEERRAGSPPELYVHKYRRGVRAV